MVGVNQNNHLTIKKITILFNSLLLLLTRYIEPVSKYHLWKPRPDPITHNPESGWTLNSKRTGVLAKKLGMSGDWNEWGQRLPLTFLQVNFLLSSD